MRRIIDKPATAKDIYIWNMVGSLSNALCSMVFLLIVSRTLVAKQSDMFSLGFSIAQLMFTVATFQMRVFQATDVREEFSFGQYFSFRIITSLVMIGVMVLYCVLNHYTGYKAIVIYLLCIYKMIDAIGDVFEGLYQQHERLDLAGKYLTIRVIPTLIIFALVSILTRELIFSCMAIVICILLIMVIYAIRHTGQFLDSNAKLLVWNSKVFGDMFIRVLPIFIGGFVLMYIFNVPKNSIDNAITNGVLADGSQTIYNIIFMPASVINLLFIFFRPQITKMAIFCADEKYSELNNMALRIGMLLMGFTVIVAVAGGTIGIPILGLIFGKNLSLVRWDLVLVLIGGGLSAVAALMDNLLTIFRKQHLNLIGYAISLLLAVYLGSFMVNRYGLHGAAVTYAASMMVLLVVLIVICYIVERKLREVK